MNRPIVAVILAGGVGSRLYPASRSDRPKQFLSLGTGRADGESDESLLARTVARADFADEVLVSTRPAFADEVPEHAPDAEVIVEPVGQDTGPAVLYATWMAREHVNSTGEDDGDESDDGNGPDEEPVVVCLPADHHVPDEEAFAATMRRGARVAAETDSLVTFGVEPTRPDTGYGYIELGEARTADRDRSFDLAAFHEKPGVETAREYVESGYRWNAGIFAWLPTALFAAARDTPLGPLVAALEDGDPERGFDAVEPVSIDYGVLERADRAAVVPADFTWDDLGSWDALERVLGSDADDNTLSAETPDSNVLALEASGNVVASDGKHVSLVGVDDLCVIAYDDRVLVVPKAEAQRVREVVARLKADGAF